MAQRRADAVRVESLDGDGAGPASFDRFTTLQLSNDLTAPSYAAFELGDDGSWPELADRVRHGRQFRVFVNDQPRMTGRVKVRDAQVDAEGGSAIRFTVQTKLSDALVGSADPRIAQKDLTLKEYLLRLYEPLGFVESDFVFDPRAGRDLLTGAESPGGKSPPDIERIDEERARVNPPEPPFMAADRHLRRHGLMHWDSPDGKIVVGAPNDDQPPRYTLRMLRGRGGQANNLLSFGRTEDWSQVPSLLGVYGSGSKAGFARAKVGALVQDDDVVEAGFYHPVIITADSIATQRLALAAARRELSARQRDKDVITARIDGLSYWTGSERIGWATDTVADVLVDVLGGVVGEYLVHQVMLDRTPSEGDVTSITASRRGLWRLS